MKIKGAGSAACIVQVCNESFLGNGHVKMDLVSAAETPTVHHIKDCVMSDTVDGRV